MGKILFIQTAFIGDAILASAMLEKWHKSHPNDQISLLVRKGNESLFSAHPFIHELLIWEKNNGKYASLLKVLKRIRKNKYDLVVNMHRFASSGILTAFSGAKETRGFIKNPLSRWFDLRFDHPIGSKGDQAFLHETARNQQLIAKETGSTPEHPKLYPNAEEKRKVEPFISDPFVTISPSSVWATKAWPSEKWVSVLKRVSHAKVYLLGGPGDKEFLQSIKEKSDHQNVEVLAGKLSLLASAELMKHAKMNFVNDSAPLHLASAMDAPVTVLFCSTIPEFGFGPTRDHAQIIETSKQLECRPCGLHGKKVCPLDHFNCAMTIEEQEIVQKINQVL